MPEQACVVCGCTAAAPCTSADGSECARVGENLCTACTEPLLPPWEREEVSRGR